MRSKTNREFCFRKNFPTGHWQKSSEFRESDSYDRDQHPEYKKVDHRFKKLADPAIDERQDEHSVRSRFTEPYSRSNFSQGHGMWDMNFSGRGPKGYVRSDERIREDVCETLYQHPLVDASDIEVKVIEGIVTLSGSVDSRETKCEAEKSIEHISGVIDVFNLLKLKKINH